MNELTVSQKSPEFLKSIDELTVKLKQKFALGTTGYVIGDADYERKLLKEGYKIKPPDESTRFIIAFGGDRVFYYAKRLAAQFKAFLVLIARRDFAAAPLGYNRLYERGFCRIAQMPPCDFVVFDKDSFKEKSQNLADAFGSIFSVCMALFDACFNAQMLSEQVPYKALEGAIDLCNNTLKGFKRHLKRKNEICEVLYGLQIECAAISLQAGILAIFQSGVSQIFEALKMLFKAEGRKLKSRGETEFLLCIFLCDFYLNFLTVSTLDFIAPPDNNKRIRAISEYFNADLKSCCINISPLFSVKKMRLYEYKCNEYRNENIMLLQKLKGLYANAFSVFKRLYDDDGYSLINYIDQSDLSLCLALAPDVSRAGSMLSYIKQTGILEKYVI